MAWSLRTVAALAGIANALAFAWISSSETLIGDDASDVPWIHTAIFVSLAGCAGLLVAELLHRALGPSLREALWSRALVLVLGFGLGGALTGVCMVIANLTVLIDPATGNTFLGLASFIPVAMVAGGLVGAAEGFVLAGPLAVLLGLSVR